MLKILTVIGVCLLLVITTTTGKVLGINQIVTTSSSLIIIALLLKLLKGEVLLFKRANTAELFYIGVVITVAFFQYLGYNGFGGMAETLITWLFPILLLIYFKDLDYSTKLAVQKILICFFIAECSLAIFERIIGVNFFPYIPEDEINVYVTREVWEFRSTAFWGHPLLNANIVSIILAYLLLGDFKVKYKLIFYIMGMLALLAFNARGATLVWGLLTLLLFVKTYTGSSGNNKTRILLVFIGLFLVFAYLMFNSTWGGRLINNKEIVDESAKIRLEAYNIINGLDIHQMIFGGIAKEYYTENSYINIVLKYGFLFGIMLICAQFAVVFKWISRYSFYERCIIFIAFIGVGSLNNNLTSSAPFMVFILCAVCLHPYQLIKVSHGRKSENISYHPFVQ